MKSDRQLLYTQVASYADRQKIWQEAIDATRRHIQVANAFQDTAIRMIKRVREEDGNAEDLTKCIASLERGAKIERDANRELIALYNIQPRPPK